MEPTYFVPIDIYLTTGEYSGLDAKILKIGDGNFYLPHLDESLSPGTGQIARYGIPTDLYTKFSSWIDSPLFTGYQYKSYDTWTINPIADNLFPNLNMLVESEYTAVLIVNKINGVVFTGTGWNFWSSLDSYFSGEYESRLGIPMYAVNFDGGGSTKGNFNPVTYISSGIITDESASFSFKQVKIRGIASEDNTLEYAGTGTYNSSDLLWINRFFGGAKKLLTDNPYEPGGSSKPGDLPPGTFEDTSDPIPDSSLPTISAANTGFTRIYNPTLSQVQDLAKYLWTDETVIQTIWNKIKQYFEDPMQAIIGFNLVPVSVPDSGSQSFALMYIDTGVSMNVAANQFVDVDCGTCKIERYYGSAIDHSPYTRIHCFLPYIGMVQLSTDEVMGTELQVKYRVDIVSGSCVAKVLVDGNVLYQYSGHCAINIPISSSDFSSYVSAAISVAKLAVGAAVGGAMGAATASVSDPSQATDNKTTTTIETVNTVRNPATNRQITESTTRQTIVADLPKQKENTKASFAGLSSANISNTVGQIMGAKPNIQHSGSFSGNTGYLGIRRPYLIIERPNMCLPAQYQQFNGFPAMITMKLSECKGYTRVQQVQLTGVEATNPEQAEILELLKSGVIF